MRMNLIRFSSEPVVGPETRRQIRRWVLERLQAGPELSVSVHELRCSEPGCPDVETVLLVARGSGRTTRYRLVGPAAAVTQIDIDRAVGAGRT